MFEITLQETRVYQEAKQEGLEQGVKIGREQGLQQGLQQGREQAQLEVVPQFLALGMSMQEVAQSLNLTIEQVEQIRLASEQESSTLTW
jgi:predicted transposase/invertase (TIGR01784 family)